MNINERIVQECRGCISEGNTDKAIKILLKQISNPDKSIILMSGRWKMLNSNKISGTISNEDYFLNKGIIDDSILTILDTLQPSGDSELEVKNIDTFPNKRNKIIYIVAAILLLSIGSTLVYYYINT